MNFVAVHIPVEPADIIAIERMIAERDIIRSVYSDSEFDRYSLGAYLEEVHVHGSKFVALLDRNIFSDIIAVVRGTLTTRKKILETQRAACALLAFFQLSDTLIEPGMAIYEHMDSSDYECAEEELSLFRSADNANPQVLIDIALGRSNSLPANEVCSVKTRCFNALKGDDIHRWKLHYGLTLKIAAIEQSGGNDAKKVKEYLEWIYRDYVFLASAVIFGIIYFSGQRIRKMLKGLNSGKIEKVKRGLRNAAWDMTVAHYWSKKAIDRKHEGEFWFLCTEDKALKEIASYIASSYALRDDLEEKTKFLFVKYMGNRKGESLYNFYKSLVERHDDSSRMINKLKSQKALYPFIDQLEEQLFSISK